MTAIDGASALSLASTQGPDVVLMDMSMPVMDGWETTRRMKADAGTASIRIIALTAHAMAADRARALAAGCDDFDTKPVDLDRLIAKIDAVTAGRSA
jgi:CheY-like chemotaxis protein